MTFRRWLGVLALLLPAGRASALGEVPKPCPPKRAWFYECDNFGQIYSTDVAAAVVVGPTGDLVVAGWVESTDQTRRTDWMVVKLSAATGGEVWRYYYNNGAGSAPYDYARGVAVDGSGYAYVVGNDDFGFPAGSDWRILKFDPGGGVVASASFGGAAGRSDNPSGVAVDPATGACVVVGYESTGAGSTRWRIMKWSADLLTVLWSRTWSPTNADWSSAGAVAIDGTGNVIVVGQAGRSDMGTGMDWAVRTYDSAGNLLWSRTENGSTSHDDAACAVTTGPGGEVYACGWMNEDSSQYGWGTEWAVRGYGADGSDLWAAGWKGTWYSGQKARSIVRNSAGELTVLGAGAGNSGWGFRRYDAAGQFLWEASDSGGVYAAAYDLQGRLIGAGSTNVSTSYDLYGGGNWRVVSYEDRQPTPCIEGLSTGRVIAYPNPVNGDMLTVAVDVPQGAAEFRLDVLNLRREVVWRGSWQDVRRVEAGVVVKGVDAWAPGIYFLKAEATLPGGTVKSYPPARVVVRP